MNVRSAELAAVTGRFQPFHVDHLSLVLHALEVADRVSVAITNPDHRSRRAEPSSPHRHLESANPFTYVERLRMITAALRHAGVPADRFEIVPFPLDDPTTWSSYVPVHALQVVRISSSWERDKADGLERHGHPVLRLQLSSQERVSASDIRAAIAGDQPWAHLVPQGVTEVLLRDGEAALRARCGRLVDSTRP